MQICNCQTLIMIPCYINESHNSNFDDVHILLIDKKNQGYTGRIAYTQTEINRLHRQNKHLSIDKIHKLIWLEHILGTD